MNTDLRKRYRFFRKHGGGCVGENAKGALQLARAEIAAEARSWKYEWPWDEGADYSFVDDWPEKERARFLEIDHEVLGCVLKDSTDEHLESLWGIFDASREYGRVVEAELAVEALHREREALAICH